MNIELLNLLKSNKNYISGEEISKKFNITRSAVWKQIKILKNNGYKIEGITKKGYKLISCPDILLPEHIENKLKNQFIGKKIHKFETLSSTNITAKELSNSCANGSIVLAETQEGGRGRFQREWSSPKGGLWFSIILKPDIEPIYAAKLTQVAAASLVQTLISMGLSPKIKWPNDIYLNDKKICGILTEMKCDMDRIDYIVLGIGLNVNIDSQSFSEEAQHIATSLSIETGKKLDREQLLVNFLENLEPLYIQTVKYNNFFKALKICRDNSMILSKKAYVVNSNGKEEVTCIKIDDDGNLIVKDKNNKLRCILSGEVTFK